MNPPDDKNSLRETLSSWRVQPTVDPNFRPAVWQRIRHVMPETWSAYLRRHVGLWSAVAIVAVTAAGWAGVSAQRAQLHDQREAMVSAYLVELDPRVQAALRP